MRVCDRSVHSEERENAGGTVASDGGDKATVDFGAIVGELPSYDIPRRFLASLQLANAGHVRLHHPGASILSGACGHEKGAARHHSQEFFRLELLTGEAELDSVGVLEDFRAPSAR